MILHINERRCCSGFWFNNLWVTWCTGLRHGDYRFNDLWSANYTGSRYSEWPFYNDRRSNDLWGWSAQNFVITRAPVNDCRTNGLWGNFVLLLFCRLIVVIIFFRFYMGTLSSFMQIYTIKRKVIFKIKAQLLRLKVYCEKI